MGANVPPISDQSCFFSFFLLVVVVFFIKGLPFALLISASKLKFFYNSQNYCRLSTPRGHIDFKTTIAGSSNIT